MNQSFWNGFFFFMLCDSMFQDYMGLEPYITWLRVHNVVVTWWWLWLFPITAILFIELVEWARRELVKLRAQVPTKGWTVKVSSYLHRRD